MYQESRHGSSLAPALFIGPAPPAVLEDITMNWPTCQDAAAQSLSRISDLLDLLSLEIKGYHTLHGILTRPTVPESVDNDAALECMETSLEDIAAALAGLHACAQKTPEWWQNNHSHTMPEAG